MKAAATKATKAVTKATKAAPATPATPATPAAPTLLDLVRAYGHAESALAGTEEARGLERASKNFFDALFNAGYRQEHCRASGGEKFGELKALVRAKPYGEFDSLQAAIDALDKAGDSVKARSLSQSIGSTCRNWGRSLESRRVALLTPEERKAEKDAANTARIDRKAEREEEAKERIANLSPTTTNIRLLARTLAEALQECEAAPFDTTKAGQQMAALLKVLGA